MHVYVKVLYLTQVISTWFCTILLFQSRKYRELTTKFHNYENVNDFIYTYHT